MEKALDILAFLEKARSVPVVDVRTPAEFRQGHIPGSVNLPLFSDEERAIVGTKYKQAGKKEAVLMGLDFAGPKMSELASRASGLAVDHQLLVHCWRGGMRSKSMAWLFETAGLKSLILEGGYKSFRRHVLSCLENDFMSVVVGGLTGSGKTDILRALQEKGEQVLDLEMLARHKGSAFGALGEDPQGTNEQFENDVFHILNMFDKSRRVWIEDESRTIGKITLPAGLYRNIRNAPVVFIDVPLESRLDRLVRDYAGYSETELKSAIMKIRPRLGDLAAKLAIGSISRENQREAVEIILRYYDKTYRYGLKNRAKDSVFALDAGSNLAPGEQADLILGFVKQKRIFV